MYHHGLYLAVVFSALALKNEKKNSKERGRNAERKRLLECLQKVLNIDIKTTEEKTILKIIDEICELETKVHRKNQLASQPVFN